MKRLAQLFQGKEISSVELNEYGIGFVLSDGSLVTISQKNMTVTQHEYEGDSIKKVTQDDITYWEGVELVILPRESSAS